MTRADQTIQWDLAGITGADQGLDRSVSASWWVVPRRVEVDGDYLLWTWLGGDINYKTVRPAPGMLERFVDLADADDEKIAAYALKWGTLMVRGLDGARSYPDGRPPREGLWQDPLADWRHYSTAMRSIINVAARLHHGQRGAEEDWQAIYARSPKALASRYWGADVPGQKFTVQEVIDELLLLGRVTPKFTWHEEGPRVVLAQTALFGALTVQLMLAVSRSSGLAVCSECALPYPVSRKPNRNQRNYCPTCRAMGVPERDASRDYRKRRMTKGEW